MKAAFSMFLLLMVSAACDDMLLGEQDSAVSLQENLDKPVFLEDGWNVSSLEAEGVTAGGLRNLITRLQAEPANTHSIIIIKNNKLILEAYFGGWHKHRLQSIRSISKSINSALLGIAIDKQFISDVGEKVFDFFPEYSDLRTPGKELITIENLLTMSAGLQWDQTTYDDDDPRNDEEQLSRSTDGLRFTLQKPVIVNPGVAFNYSSGNSDLLAAIIDHATGIPTDIYAARMLFEPLKITNYGWRKNNNNYVNAGYGLHMQPRDLAKIGQLYLDSGSWKGTQIISRDWIRHSTEKGMSIPGSPNQGYGYQWWTRNWIIDDENILAIQAQGSGGQLICILPKLNAVVVITGSNNGQLSYNLLEQYLLPALIGE